MARLIQNLCIFFHFSLILHFTTGESDELQKRFTSKCNDLCAVKTDKSDSIGEVKLIGRNECLRGCQYFNIEFLTSARNKGKAVDLNQLVERCGASCRDAYTSDKEKKEKCFGGCNEMMSLQAKAPYINGWLVYMGATDRNMVLLQPEFDLPSGDNWQTLRSNDYEYDTNIENYERILIDNQGHTQAVPVFNERHFTINYCIPTWMWMVPLLLLLGFIWIHYSNFIYGVFIRESIDTDLSICGPEHLNGFGPVVLAANEKKYLQNEFVVGNDYYFYPSPAVPPPKYNDVVESIFLSDDEEEPLRMNDGDHRNDEIVDENLKKNNQQIA